MIQLKKVNKIYAGLAGKVHALIDADILIEKGESTVIIGKSGSGKSTLLNIFSGIDRCESGQVLINNVFLHTLSENELAKWRGKNIGIVFQNFQLIPTLSALDNVLFPMDLVNVIYKKERKVRAKKLLTDVGLEDKINKFPNELSGGEIQRVAIARALANDPPIILADEPTGNLDSITGDKIYQVFQSLIEMGKTIVIVTHENICKRNFSKVITIQDGKIINNTI
jgi:putative ABC transport system ATP-binding protein